ncbi:MAG: hypothetical protein A2498_05300 [Lentisphaerae bacterium RIFOXYC12_FULL_60_16]|nr:MAG: hypothetical protein A2498_05300 [Lentisphaerae bacterium RIFOXYC12_FULL_60_16]
MNFDWDPRKAASNVRKHGVNFHEAAMIFADPLSITVHDPDHSVTEHRFITVGMDPARRVLIVSHADRGDTIRLISARKTTQQERRYYEEGK